MQVSIAVANLTLYRHLEYIVRRGKGGATFVRKHYGVESRPDELGDKTRLLGHFSTYLMQKLYGEHDYAFVDHQRTSGMDFVQKYLRLKHAILFKLSNDVLQVASPLNVRMYHLTLLSSISTTTLN
jgi:hypothetical protein